MISDAGRMCDLQPDQVVGAILALRLATMPRDIRKFLSVSPDQARASAMALSLGLTPKAR